MLIERPPLLFRLCFPEAAFRIHGKRRRVFLTFDDGPIPEVTPWVLDTLDRYGIKATFFMVGDNVRKHPEVYRMVCERGHAVGNHTMHHLQGSSDDYAPLHCRRDAGKRPDRGAHLPSAARLAAVGAGGGSQESLQPDNV